MEPSDIIAALLRRDETVTRTFFYGAETWSFRPNLIKLLQLVFHGTVPYDEAVGELYTHLLADDGRRLRSYDAARASFWYWLRTVAVRFFLDRRDGLIDSRGKPRIENREDGSEHVIEEARPPRSVPEPEDGGAGRAEARRDIQRLLFLMPNKRYAYVLQHLLLLGEEPRDLADRMGIRTANLYNLRKRAYEQLERTAMKDRLYYERH